MRTCSPLNGIISCQAIGSKSVLVEPGDRSGLRHSLPLNVAEMDSNDAVSGSLKPVKILRKAAQKPAWALQDSTGRNSRHNLQMREDAVATHEAYWQMKYQQMTTTHQEQCLEYKQMTTTHQEKCHKASFANLKVRVKEEEIEPKPRIKRSYGNLYEKAVKATVSWGGLVPASFSAATPKSSARKRPTWSCSPSSSSHSSYSSYSPPAKRRRTSESCGNSCSRANRCGDETAEIYLQPKLQQQQQFLTCCENTTDQGSATEIQSSKTQARPTLCSRI